MDPLFYWSSPAMNQSKSTSNFSQKYFFNAANSKLQNFGRNLQNDSKFSTFKERNRATFQTTNIFDFEEEVWIVAGLRSVQEWEN